MGVNEEKPRTRNASRGMAIQMLVVAAALGLAIVAEIGVGIALTRPYTFSGLVVQPAQPVPDFTLVNQDQQPFRLGAVRTKYVLLFFGYTHCPDVCPLTLAKMGKVYKELGADSDRIRFIFVTVDPGRDSSQRLKEYLAQFNPAFIGLTGSVETIEEVAKNFNAYFKKEYKSEEDAPHDHELGKDLTQETARYEVYHTALTYVIDPTGNLIMVFRYRTDAPEIAADLKNLLKQK